MEEELDRRTVNFVEGALTKSALGDECKRTECA